MILSATTSSSHPGAPLPANLNRAACRPRARIAHSPVLRWLAGLPAARVATRPDCHRLAHHHSRLLPPQVRRRFEPDPSRPARPPPRGAHEPILRLRALPRRSAVLGGRPAVPRAAAPRLPYGAPPCRARPPHRGRATAPREGRRAEGGPPCRGPVRKAQGLMLRATVPRPASGVLASCVMRDLKMVALTV